MFLSLVLAAVLTANQGSVVHLTVPDEAGIKSMELKWEGKTIPLVRTTGKWETVVGVDLDTKAGEHTGEIVLNFENNRADRRPVSIVVESVKFPTTELKVDDQYVQLSPANQQRANREAKELEGIYSKLTPEILWTKPFKVPVDGQVKGSNFGHRRV